MKVVHENLQYQILKHKQNQCNHQPCPIRNETIRPAFLSNLDTHQSADRKQHSKRESTHHEKQIVRLVRTRQHLGTQRTHHQSVGNPHQNNPQLTQNDGISQFQRLGNLYFVDPKWVLHGIK